VKSLAALLVLALFATCSAAEDAMPKSVLDVTLPALDGKPYPLAQLKGSVILLVNVASKCGNTPQYSGLEAMYEKYKAAGLVIVGVPANNFGGQEPGTNEQIAEFCSSTYKVKFPMLGKVSVKGDDITPLYKYLTTASPKPGPVTWNFEKFLIDRDGQVVDRFAPKTKVEDPKVVESVEKALAAKAK
jgi:glutathione peroxidase